MSITFLNHGMITARPSRLRVLAVVCVGYGEQTKPLNEKMRNEETSPETASIPKYPLNNPPVSRVQLSSPLSVSGVSNSNGSVPIEDCDPTRRLADKDSRPKHPFNSVTLVTSLEARMQFARMNSHSNHVLSAHS